MVAVPISIPMVEPFPVEEVPRLCRQFDSRGSEGLPTVKNPYQLARFPSETGHAALSIIPEVSRSTGTALAFGVGTNSVKARSARSFLSFSSSSPGHDGRGGDRLPFQSSLHQGVGSLIVSGLEGMVGPQQDVPPAHR